MQQSYVAVENKQLILTALLSEVFPQIHFWFMGPKFVIKPPLPLIL